MQSREDETENIYGNKKCNNLRYLGRVFLDISSIKYTSLGGARFWVLMMDDCSGFLTSFFLKKKSDLKEKGVKMLKKN